MSVDRTRLTECPVCGTTFEQARRGRPRVYCGNDCKQAAYRRRAGHVLYAVGYDSYSWLASPDKRFPARSRMWYGGR